MTFLQLFVSFFEEYGFSGDAPTTVVNQTGERKRMVNWLKNAYNDIQGRNNNWNWMRVGFSVSTVADDDTYSYGDCTDALTTTDIARFSRWRVDDPYDPGKIYLTSSGVGTQTYLTYTPWDTFKGVYRMGSQNSGHPAHITIDPQNKLILGPNPNGIYVVSGDFQRSNQTLALDADEPEMPSDYHMLIVHQAARKYAYYESANEVLARANEEGNRLMSQLEINQLPPIGIASAMA